MAPTPNANFVFIVSLFLFLISSSLMSHQRSESYSKVIIDNTEDTTQVDVEFSIQTSILQRLKKKFSEGLGARFNSRDN